MLCVCGAVCAYEWHCLSVLRWWLYHPLTLEQQWIHWSRCHGEGRGGRVNVRFNQRRYWGTCHSLWQSKIIISESTIWKKCYWIIYKLCKRLSEKAFYTHMNINYSLYMHLYNTAILCLETKGRGLRVETLSGCLVRNQCTTVPYWDIDV
jgi:hypothetical protein